MGQIGRVMQLATLRNDYGDESLHYFHDRHFIAVEDVASVFGAFFPTDLRDLLESGELAEMIAWWDREADERLPRMPEFSIHQDAATPASPLVRPRRLWGVEPEVPNREGDIASGGPTYFLRPDTALVGPGDEFGFPEGSDRLSGRAALAMIVGRDGLRVPEEEWLSVVAGFTTALEITDEDRLRELAGSLTLAKGFDRSLSLGPLFLSRDELPEEIGTLTVASWLNGEPAGEGGLCGSAVTPARIVAELSRSTTLKPGDVITLPASSSVDLSEGDTLECRVEGAPFLPLVNPVISMSVQ